MLKVYVTKKEKQIPKILSKIINQQIKNVDHLAGNLDPLLMFKTNFFPQSSLIVMIIFWKTLTY